MFCKYCGAQIADDSIFCASCGKVLNKKTSEPEEAPVEYKGRHAASVSSITSVDNPKYEEIASPETKEWFYRSDENKVCGPLTYAEMLEDISIGDVYSDYEVKPAGSNEWIPIMSTVFAAKVPQRPETVTVYLFDRFVWCLAIVPLLLMMILEKIGLYNSLGDFAWLIVIGINSLFLFLDKAELDKLGTNASSKWWFVGLLLVPVYLLVREVKTNHNYCPFIIWCFLFAVLIFII